jgi:hypothetical protein
MLCYSLTKKILFLYILILLGRNFELEYFGKFEFAFNTNPQYVSRDQVGYGTFYEKVVVKLFIGISVRDTALYHTGQILSHYVHFI